MATHHEIRTTTKVEDDRSLGDKAKDAFNSAAEKTKEFAKDVKEKITGESHVTDSDIAHAARKEQHLEEKEEMNRIRAEGAAERKEQLQSDFEHLQNKELEQRRKEDKTHEKREKQAEEVVRLQNKQNEQQAERCHEALQKGTCPSSQTGEYKVTRVTEIH